MEFHLFYGRDGFIGYLYEEEISKVCGEDSLSRIFNGLSKAFGGKQAYAWKYSFRAELDSGEYWVVERDDRDIAEHMFTVTHYERWNIRDNAVRMNKRKLYSLLKNAYRKEAVQ